MAIEARNFRGMGWSWWTEICRPCTVSIMHGCRNAQNPRARRPAQRVSLRARPHLASPLGQVTVSGRSPRSKAPPVDRPLSFLAIQDSPKSCMLRRCSDGVSGLKIAPRSICNAAMLRWWVARACVRCSMRRAWHQGGSIVRRRQRRNAGYSNRLRDVVL